MHRYRERPWVALRRAACGLTLVTLLLVVGFPALAGAQQEPGGERVDEVYGRNFALENVDARVAEAWYWELCEKLAQGARCLVAQVVPGEKDMLSVHGPQSVHAAFARRLAERDAGRTTVQFQLILVEGSKSGSGFGDGLPDSARQALQDVQEFLPFQRFEMIDSGWLKTSGRGEVDLAGADGTRYETMLVFDPRIDIDGVVLNVSVFEVQERREKPNGGAQVRSLIRTSLTLEVGETAVVGTSKLNGGEKALIVLLTALES